MYRDLLNFIILITAISFLSGCSMITKNTNITDWIDKTEQWFFGEEEESEEIEIGELGKFAEEFPNINEIPMNRPPDSELEIDFIEEKSKKINKETNYENPISGGSNKIEEYTRVSNMVINLFRASDPPSGINGETINYIESDYENISNKKKIALIQFASDSVVPDENSLEIIEQIVSNFSSELIEVVGHASTRGGETPLGKKYNMKIATSRALSIKNMLINNGFPKDKILVISSITSGFLKSGLSVPYFFIAT